MTVLISFIYDSLYVTSSIANKGKPLSRPFAHLITLKRNNDVFINNYLWFFVILATQKQQGLFKWPDFTFNLNVLKFFEKKTYKVIYDDLTN